MLNHAACSSDAGQGKQWDVSRTLRMQSSQSPTAVHLLIAFITLPAGRGPQTVVDKVNLLSKELGITPEMAVKVLLPGRSGTVSALSTPNLQQKLQRIKQAVQGTPWSPADVIVASPRMLGMCGPTVARIPYVPSSACLYASTFNTPQST
jgi:hypothetical protein